MRRERNQMEGRGHRERERQIYREKTRNYLKRVQDKQKNWKSQKLEVKQMVTEKNRVINTVKV